MLTRAQHILLLFTCYEEIGFVVNVSFLPAYSKVTAIWLPIIPTLICIATKTAFLSLHGDTNPLIFYIQYVYNDIWK